jgi:ectoine hydroxylase-related dioxygenase (phytanoyl-CoA dioxygenase family)
MRISACKTRMNLYETKRKDKAAIKKLNHTLAQNGFAIVPGVLEPADLARLISLLGQADDQTSIRRRGGVYAIRNLLDVVPQLRHLATSPDIQALVQPALGPQAFPVRGILFDKTPEANWKVPWHQDLSIAVKERREVAGFGPWSTKAGVLHVQPPVSVLESMLAVRIHLDDCRESNGPVRVIPGSHLKGRLNTEQIHRISAGPAVSGTVAAGGVLLMRPLLLHASSASQSPRHRRVIHLEFASGALPGGLTWFTENY